MDDESAGGSTPPADDPVPVFGSWPAIYTAVVLSALAVMGLVALFSSWSW
jgi:hypothetical protein